MVSAENEDFDEKLGGQVFKVAWFLCNTTHQQKYKLLFRFTHTVIVIVICAKTKPAPSVVEGCLRQSRWSEVFIAEIQPDVVSQDCHASLCNGHTGPTKPSSFTSVNEKVHKGANRLENRVKPGKSDVESDARWRDWAVAAVDMIVPVRGQNSRSVDHYIVYGECRSRTRPGCVGLIHKQ